MFGPMSPWPSFRRASERSPGQDLLRKGGIMCAHAIAVWVTGFVLAAAGLFVGPAHAQRDSARPAVQDVASKPIGKVVVATGSVTLERAGAMVVQVSTAGQAGQAKVGDLVYQGDTVATG